MQGQGQGYNVSQQVKDEMNCIIIIIKPPSLHVMFLITTVSVFPGFLCAGRSPRSRSPRSRSPRSRSRRSGQSRPEQLQQQSAVPGHPVLTEWYHRPTRSPGSRSGHGERRSGGRGGTGGEGEPAAAAAAEAVPGIKHSVPESTFL